MALRYIRGRFRPRPTKVTQSVLGVVENFDQLLAIVSNKTLSVSQRVTAAGMIRASIEETSLSSIQEVWYSVAQLLDLSNQTELRRSGWKLALSCIEYDEINAGSYNTYYHAIIDYSNVEDFDLVLQALDSLTQGGRRFSNAPTASYRLPRVLLSWIQLLAVRTQELQSNSSAKDVAEQWGESTPANFAALLAYTVKALKFNMSVFDERDIKLVLLCIVTIMRSTPSTKVIELCCSIIDTVMAYGIIPLQVLKPILQVLCGITFVNTQLAEIGWNTILNLLRSHLGNSTIQRLCRILDSHDSQVTVEMRIAAARMLAKSLRETAQRPEEQLPLVEVLGAYSTSLSQYSPSLHIEVAKCLDEILSEPLIKPHLSFDIWQSVSFSPLSIVCKLGDSVSMVPRGRLDQTRLAAADSDPGASTIAITPSISKILDTILELVEEKDSHLPMEESLETITQLSKFLSHSSALKVVALYHQLHLCSPYLNGWKHNLDMLLAQFYQSKNCTDAVRGKIIELCEPVLMLPGDESNVFSISQKLFSEIWSCNLSSLSVLMSLLKDIALRNTTALFEQISNSVVRHFPDQSTEASANEETSLKLEKIASTFVDIFIALFQTSPRKLSLVYNHLVTIARLCIFDSRPFQVAFALLCRLRVNEENAVLITEPTLETDYGTALHNQQVPLAIKKSLLDKPSLCLRICGSDIGGSELYTPDLLLPKQALDTTLLLQLIIKVLYTGAPERVYLQVLINTSSQLSNIKFFNECEGEVVNLRNFLCRQVGAVNVPKLLDDRSGASKQEILGVYVHILTIILGYSQIFTKQDYDKLLQTLVQVLSNWDKITSCWALHCLVICCYECPQTLQRVLPQILSKLQTKITNRDSSPHILEFLLTLSQVESLTSSFNTQEFKRAFGICFTYIQHATDNLNKSKTDSDMNASILSQYLLRLACVIISSLFLAIEMSARDEMVAYLIRNFVLSSKVKGHLDPINLCTYDLLCRYTYSDLPLGLTSKASELGRYSKEGDNTAVWMIGCSLIEVITNKSTGKSFAIVRRPTCTIVVAIKPIDGSIIATSDRYDETASFSEDNVKFLANFWLLMMRGLDSDGQNPIKIPTTPANLRAISTLDRAPVVDFHKVGIIYIGPGQNQEQQILANTCGSRAYREFLGGMGQFVRLKGNRAIYAGGLDTENDIDGEFTLAWVGKVSQITYHVITLMPNPEHDPSLSSKKRHIGNNYVNIYFDESGKEFDFDVVKSQFNFINIVISPTCAPHKFRLRAYRKEGLANVLAAFETKVVDKQHLSLFIRHLSIKASIYAKVYNQHGEYTDQWLYRLELIDKLRARVIQEREPQHAEEADSEYMREALAKLDFSQ